MIWLYIILSYISSVFFHIVVAYSLWVRERPNDCTLGQFKRYANDDDTFCAPFVIMFVPGLNTLLLALIPIAVIVYFLNNSNFDNMKIR